MNHCLAQIISSEWGFGVLGAILSIARWQNVERDRMLCNVSGHSDKKYWKYSSSDFALVTWESKYRDSLHIHDPPTWTPELMCRCSTQDRLHPSSIWHTQYPVVTPWALVHRMQKSIECALLAPAEPLLGRYNVQNKSLWNLSFSMAQKLTTDLSFSFEGLALSERVVIPLARHHTYH